jgi:hypothetical protein
MFHLTQSMATALLRLLCLCITVHVAAMWLAGAGGMTWHGRDLRQYRRLLAPPLERLLTCPGE